MGKCRSVPNGWWVTWRRAYTAAITEWRTTLEGFSSTAWRMKNWRQCGSMPSVRCSAQPNDVTDEMFDRMKKHWTEGQIVEIVAVISFFGFMNGYNDTLATPLEDEPIAVAAKHISQHGWTLGKHRR